jgi:spectinomycin phosphotransferase
MLEKPNLDDDAIVAALREHYGLDVASLKFLPIGNDVGSFAYRVEGRDGTTYFLKARRAPMYEPSVVVPHYLRQHGLVEVVAPLPTLTRTLWVPFGDFNLILFLFIDAPTGKEAGMTAQQWTELGRLLKRLHTLTPSSQIRELVSQDSFETPYWVASMQKLQTRIDQPDSLDSIAAELAGFWRARQGQIYDLMARTLALVRKLHDEPREFVLCHSDIHTANVLVEDSGALHIVDWDQPLFAPKERDLMFYGAGLGSATGGATEARCFYEGYGATKIDRLAFAYYRYGWVMQDWVANADEVLSYDDLGEKTRRNSVRKFIQMFDSGNIVDVSYASDDL